MYPAPFFRGSLEKIQATDSRIRGNDKRNTIQENRLSLPVIATAIATAGG